MAEKNLNELVKTVKALKLAESQHFENYLLSLPDDVVDAYEKFKLTILRHRAENWYSIGEHGMVMVLWDLIQLTVRKKDEKK